jgi:hypothetical protein
MATITSADGVYSATALMLQDPNGLYVVDISGISTTNASSDIINVRVQGQLVWQGLAGEATGG